MAAGDNCGGCGYFKSAKGNPGLGAYGQCQRYPPVVFQSGNPGGAALWPTVRGLDWCGDFLKPAAASDPENPDLGKVEAAVLLELARRAIKDEPPPVSSETVDGAEGSADAPRLRRKKG